MKDDQVLRKKNAIDEFFFRVICQLVEEKKMTKFPTVGVVIASQHLGLTHKRKKGKLLAQVNKTCFFPSQVARDTT